MTRSAADLDVGQSAQVARIAGTDDVSRRLLEMGVTPGVEIRRLGAAPLGDPLEFELRGYRLSLRRKEAEHIESKGLRMRRWREQDVLPCIPTSTHPASFSYQCPYHRPSKTIRVALVGNPNTGKSTLFTALAGVRQRVGNYPGVTVEKKTGHCGTMGSGLS